MWEEIKYGTLPRVSEYITFMRDFLTKDTPPLKESERRSLDRGLKKDYEYPSLASFIGSLMRNNVPVEIFSVIPQSDVEWIMIDEERREDFIANLLNKNISPDALQAMANSRFPVKEIAKHILKTLDVQKAQEIFKAIQLAIAQNIPPADLRHSLQEIIANTYIIKQFGTNSSPLIAGIVEEGESNYLFKFFAGAIARYTMDYVLKQMGMPAKSFSEANEIMLNHLNLERSDPRIGGSVNPFGAITVNLTAGSITELFLVSSHETVHYIARTDLREEIGLSSESDIRWLLSSALGTFNATTMESSLLEAIVRFYGRGEDNLNQDISPILTHARLRKIPSSATHSWKATVAYINDPKSNKGAGSEVEPESSYVEGDNLGRYATLHYGQTGAFFLKLYASANKNLNFASMELAAAILRDILKQYTLNIPIHELEKTVINSVISKNIPDDIDYQSLDKIEKALLENLTSSLAAHRKLLLKKDSKGLSGRSITVAQDGIAKKNVNGIDNSTLISTAKLPLGMEVSVELLNDVFHWLQMQPPETLEYLHNISSRNLPDKKGILGNSWVIGLGRPEDRLLTKEVRQIIQESIQRKGASFIKVFYPLAPPVTLVQIKTSKGFGSAFIAGEDDQYFYLMTNWHVVSSGLKLKRMLEGLLGKFKPVEIVLDGQRHFSGDNNGRAIALDSKDDMAIIKVKKEDIPDGKVAQFNLNSNSSKGYFYGAEPQWSRINRQSFPSPGWSGGPELDQEGHVINMAVSKELAITDLSDRPIFIPQETKYNRIPAAKIVQFLQKNKIPGVQVKGGEIILKNNSERRLPTQILSDLERLEETEQLNLGKYLGEKQLIQQLIDRTRDGNPAIRRAAYEALGKIGLNDVDAVEAVLKGFDDENVHVQRQAIEALEKIGQQPNEQVVIALSKKADHPELQSSILKILAEIGHGNGIALKAMAEMTKNQDILFSVARAMGNFIMSGTDSSDAMRILYENYELLDKTVGYFLVEPVANIGQRNPLAVEMLLDILEHLTTGNTTFRDILDILALFDYPDQLSKSAVIQTLETYSSKYSEYDYPEIKRALRILRDSHQGYVSTVESFPVESKIIPDLDELINVKKDQMLKQSNYIAITETEQYTDGVNIFQMEELPLYIFSFSGRFGQGDAFDRLGIFVEHPEYKGQILPLEKTKVLLRRMGKNTLYDGHDYSLKDIAAFFTAAYKQNMELNVYEKKARDILLNLGLMTFHEDSGYSVNKTAFVFSYSQDLDPSTKSKILNHEVIAHALYFTNTDYRKEVADIYNTLSEGERRFVRAFLVLQGYDVAENEELLRSEFAAYFQDGQTLVDILDRKFSRNFGGDEVQDPKKRLAWKAIKSLYQVDGKEFFFSGHLKANLNERMLVFLSKASQRLSALASDIRSGAYSEKNLAGRYSMHNDQFVPLLEEPKEKPQEMFVEVASPRGLSTHFLESKIDYHVGGGGMMYSSAQVYDSFDQDQVLMAADPILHKSITKQRILQALNKSGIKGKFKLIQSNDQTLILEYKNFGKLPISKENLDKEINLIMGGSMTSNVFIISKSGKRQVFNFVKNTFKIDRDNSTLTSSILGVGEGGFSVKDYVDMSSADREARRGEFREVFKPRLSEVNRILKEPAKKYVLTDDQRMEELLESSQTLRKIYPTDRIVSFGRSPLWFVETARLLESEEGKQIAPDRFIYLAFSGHWWEKQDKGPRLTASVSRPGPPIAPILRPISAAPNKAQIAVYREYLTKLNLDPMSIIGNKEKTIIVEYTQYGQSVKSLLSLLQSWAQELGVEEKFLSKIIVHILQDPMLAKVWNLGGFHIVHQEVNHDLVKELANSDDFEDSLGVHYQYLKWDQVNPLEAKVSRNASLVQFRIIDFMATKGLIHFQDSNLSNLQSPLELKIEAGISYAFQHHPKLSAIGNEQEYSEYLGDRKILFRTDTPGTPLIQRGFAFFTKYESEAKGYFNKYAAELRNPEINNYTVDLKNPVYTQYDGPAVHSIYHNGVKIGIISDIRNPEFIEKLKSLGYDGIVAEWGSKLNPSNETIVFNTDSILKVGSQEDVEGFKSWKERHVGGIDLNPNKLDIQTQGQGIDFNAPFDPAMLNTPIDGFSPMIIEITPVNMPLFIGLTEEENSKELQQAKI